MAVGFIWGSAVVWKDEICRFRTTGVGSNYEMVESVVVDFLA